MRIEHVDLRRFGHFADTRVDLDHPTGGLRFIVGPNEAGKSTLRAALRTGLYGFESRTAAGLPAASSALALHLVRDDGTRLAMVRQGMGAVRDDAGQVLGTVDVDAWIPLTRDAFDRLCCLGHDELRRYGYELLQSGADLGRIAFGAALGGTHVQRVGTDLAARLGELYTPGGRARALNKALEELRTVDAELRDKTVSADAWLALRADLEREVRSLATIDDAERALSQESKRLARVVRTANARVAIFDHRAAQARLRAEGPVPDPATAQRLERLLVDRGAAEDAIRASATALNALEVRLADVPTERSALDRTHEITALYQEVAGYREAVERVRQHELAPLGPALDEAERLIAAVVDASGLPEQVKTLRAEETTTAGMRARLAALKAELGIEGVADDALSSLPVPSEATIEAERDVLAEHGAQRTGHTKALEGLARDRERCERDRAALDAGGGPLPSDAEIADARERRDRAWTALRAWFVDDVPPSVGPAEKPELADTVAAGMERADRLVDHLRADTERTARREGLERQLADFERERAQREELLAQLADAEAAASDAWHGAWVRTTDRIGTPSAMSEWRTSWRQACADAAALGEADARVEVLRRSVNDATRHLREALTACGHLPPEDAGALALLARAETLVERERERRSEAEEAAIAMARTARIDGRLAELLPLLDVADRSPGDRAIQALHDLRDRQAAAHKERAALGTQIGAATEAARVARENLTRLEGDLADEAASLGIAVDGLPTAVERAEAAAGIIDKLDVRTDQLIDAGEGLSVEDLFAEAASAGDPDAINVRLEAIERERERLKEQRLEATKRQLNLESRLGELAGGDDVAALHETQARAQTRIVDLVDDIAELTLAKALLDRVVEDARTAGRGPLIERAGHYFQLLTDSAFAGLDLELHGDKSYPVAVRADGSRLYPTALSDGTLDQLWLAWRLAGIEFHLDRSSPMPVIVDDVLVNFDDQRAGSAFVALASLAERTQVLVLTHHPHLIEVARARLGTDRVAVSLMPGRPVDAASVTQVVSSSQALGRPPVPRPEAPSGASTPPKASGPPSSGSSDSGAAPVEALRKAVDGAWRGKAELVERSGIADAAWGAAVKALLTEGWIEQEGAKRGAKYRRAS